MNFILCDRSSVKRTLPFVTGSLRDGWSSSEDDSDDSLLDSSFFFPFLPTSCRAYQRYMYEKGVRWVSLETNTHSSNDLLRGDWRAVLCTGYSCNRLFEVDSLFSCLVLDFSLGRLDWLFF